MNFIRNLYKIIKKYINNRPKLKKVIGVILILVGFIALVTPLTPGSWLILVGLEIFGVRILFWDKIKVWLKTWSQKVFLWYNEKVMKKVGRVTHYYDHLGVAIVELEASLKVGDKVKFEGHGADFEQEVDSLQVNHEQVETAGSGDVIGMKTDQKVKEGTVVEKV